MGSLKNKSTPMREDIIIQDSTPGKCSAFDYNSTQSQVSGQKGKKFKMPAYDPNIKYDTEFYNMFIENQNLLEQVEREAEERNDMLMKGYRIKDYYDKNVSDIKQTRYKNGRRIHDRKTNEELEKEEECPYHGCTKQFASEGALNLHIKTKHNGGNKTDREKLAKALVSRKSQGQQILWDKLQISLPPGIIKKAAEQIK